MTKFFNEFKKPYFWPIFPIFRATKKKENISTTHNFIFQENVCTDRQMDAQSLFYRFLPATTRDPKVYIKSKR